MNTPDRLDEQWLRSLDDAQLEGLRYYLLRSGDSRVEHVVEHLLVRAIAYVDHVVAELGALRGMQPEGLRSATVDASVRLQLRLAREEHLPTIEVLASRFAREAVERVEPRPIVPPRLVSRPPRLRTIEGALGDALSDGRVTPNRGEDS